MVTVRTARSIRIEVIAAIFATMIGEIAMKTGEIAIAEYSVPTNAGGAANKVSAGLMIGDPSSAAGVKALIETRGIGRDRRSIARRTDDHYRSWRDRHLSDLDRDYRDYCREREAQFHRDFDDWRRQKYANPQPLSTGMTQSGLSHDPTGMTQARGG